MTTDSEVNKLADHLLNKGLAMTKTSALDMAKDISSTTKKLNKAKDSGKERRTSEETSAEAAKARRDNIERMRQNALNSKPVEISADYEMPRAGKDTTLNDIAGGKAPEPEAEEPEEDPMVDQVKKAEKPAVPKTPADVSSMEESKVDLGDVFKFS